MTDVMQTPCPAVGHLRFGRLSAQIREGPCIGCTPDSHPWLRHIGLSPYPGSGTIRLMKILDQEIDLEANKYALFRQHRTLFCLLLLTALMDAVSTMVFMRRIGPHAEMNWVVRILGYAYGPYVGPLLGKLYQVFGMWVISLFVPRLTRFVCITIILLNCYAFVLNLSL